MSKRQRLPGAGQRCPGGIGAGGRHTGGKAMEGISLLGPYVGSGSRGKETGGGSRTQRCHLSWAAAVAELPERDVPEPSGCRNTG